MRGLILDDQWEIALKEVPIPVPAANEVLVAPQVVGICGTDIHAPRLSSHFRPPVVLGHEFTAVVVTPGAGVRDWKQGDRVVINPNGDTCGACEECRRGDYNLCHSAVFENGIGIHRNGGLADFAAVPASCLHTLPLQITYEAGAWVEPLATAVRAVLRTPVREDWRYLVVGGGSIGLLVLQMLRVEGATDIAVLEPNALRRALSLDLGASETQAPGSEGIFTRGFDVVYECSGTTGGFRTASRLVRPSGTVVTVGISPEDLSIPSLTLVGKELSVTGSLIYNEEFATAINLLERGLIQVARMSIGPVPLSEYHEAFEDKVESANQGVKTLISLGSEPRRIVQGGRPSR